LVNVQARELALGSGGFDVLYANMTRGLELPPDADAHVMKLPYTPVQAAARHAEEDRVLPDTLAGLSVVCCSLHSQLAPVCAGTGSSFGHGGLAAAAAAHTAGALDGKPILAVRASEGDTRERHRGLSHHVRDILRLTDGVTLPWPRGFDVPAGVEVELVDVEGW